MLPLSASLVLISARGEAFSSSPVVRTICLHDLSPSQGQNDWGKLRQRGGSWDKGALLLGLRTGANLDSDCQKAEMQSRGPPI